MSILTLNSLKNYIPNAINDFESKTFDILSPRHFNSNPYSEPTLTESFANLGDTIVKQLYINALAKLDLEFCNSEHRKRNYHIKQYRNRTIITAIGEITYKRHEYTCKDTHKPFCYVDYKLSLFKRQRYTNSVRAMITDLYARQNSMIKVGEIIGDKIHSRFSLEKTSAIPRQTVFNILQTFKVTTIPTERSSSTPETLYIIADEKYIHMQRSTNKRCMTKLAIVFEDRVITNKTRYKYTNKHSIISTDNDIWDRVYDYIHSRYDVGKVKNIYIMGDGATWIKTSMSTLKNQAYNIAYGLDRFHLGQAINRIFRCKQTNSTVKSYILNNDIESFKTFIDNVKDESPQRLKIIEDNSSYIIKNWKFIQTMENVIKIGCGMEGQISHTLASRFTSVPKAYSYQRLPSYLCAVEHQSNNINIKRLYLDSLTYNKNNSEIVDIDYLDINTDLFKTSNSDLPYYLVNLKHKMH